MVQSFSNDTLQYLLRKNATLVDEPAIKNDMAQKDLSIQSLDAIGKNKDMNIVPTQKYEKIVQQKRIQIQLTSNKV